MVACWIIENASKEIYIDEILNRIIDYCIYLGATIQWIPSHVGIPGNEKADRLARSGTEGNNQQTIDNSIRLKDVLALMNKKMWEKSNEWYTMTCQTKGQKFYRFQQVLDKKMWHQKTSLKAKEIKVLNRLLAGHEYSSFWLNKMRLVEEGNCNECGAQNTARHMVFHCDKFKTERQQYGIREDKFEISFKRKDTLYMKKVYKFVSDNRMSF